jgi:hypothetical protein
MVNVTAYVLGSVAITILHSHMGVTIVTSQ